MDKIDLPAGHINSDKSVDIGEKRNNGDVNVNVNDKNSIPKVDKTHLMIDKTQPETLSLFISACFVPYIDACAITVAKRLRTWGGIIDVISLDEKEKKQKDFKLFELTKGYMNKHVALPELIRISDGAGMESFAGQAFAQAKIWQDNYKRNYTKLYSRVLFAASHTAAIVYKTHYPEVKWVADFSDPVLMNMENKQRITPLSATWYNSYIKDNLVKMGLAGKLIDTTNNANLWMELMSYILADEIMFTNPKQMEFMLNKLPFPFDTETTNKLLVDIRKRSIISAHPTLSREFYSLGKAIELPKNNKKKIAYFGIFYASRNLNDIKNLLRYYGATLEAYIYTNHVTKSLQRIAKMQENIKIFEFMNYFDFLASIDSFEAVIVIDSVVTSVLGTNPYLPSKFSDYLGAIKTPIWLMTEKNSFLDQLKLDDNTYKGRLVYRSRSGDLKEHIKVWHNISSRSK